jgi:cytochrome c-type biogenesis protein CcmF
VPVNGDLKLGEYTVKYESIAQFNAVDKRQVTRAVVGVYDNKGDFLGELHPRIDYYPDAQQNMTIPGERATMSDDLYVLLVDWQPATSTGATFKVFVNPLVNWLWIGSLLFAVGILIAVFIPDKEAERVTVAARQHARESSPAD